MLSKYSDEGSAVDNLEKMDDSYLKYSDSDV